MAADIGKLKKMIDAYDVKDEDGKVIKANKFRNCFTDRFIYGKKKCKMTSYYEEYMSDVLEKDLDLYRYVRGN